MEIDEAQKENEEWFRKRVAAVPCQSHPPLAGLAASQPF
jgi:hypothetical protein